MSYERFALVLLRGAMGIDIVYMGKVGLKTNRKSIEKLG